MNTKKRWLLFPLIVVFLLATRGIATADRYTGPWDSAAAAVWGGITGTLSNQADLQTELDARALESVVGTSLNADDLQNNGGVLETQAEIPHIDAAQEWTESQEMADDKCWEFGDDKDLQICWDSADAVLELRNSGGTPIFKFSPSNNTFWANPTTSPEVIFNDSDNPGTDKYSASIGAQYTDGADGSENNDLFVYINDAGSKTTIAKWDEDDDAWDFQTYDIVTSGEIVGRNRWGADVASSPVNHNTVALHGLMYLVTVAATVNLDAAADAGFGACVNYRIRDAAEAVIIDLDGSEYMNLAGTALAQGVGVTATGAGEYLTLCATTDANGSGADGWLIYGETSGWASE